MKTKTSKIDELVSDFKWVIKVLQSSANKNHLIVADRLFYVVFLNKWGKIDDVLKKGFTSTYSQYRFIVKHKKNI
jgi:hypothetical protein